MTSIPSVEDLRSDPLPHRFGDSFNPPGLTNFLGCVQSEIDLTGIRNLNFPPFATGPSLTAAFVFDGRHFQSLGAPVITTWYPDKIIREARFEDVALKSTTVLIPNTQTVLLLTEVRNESGAAGTWEIGWNFRPCVARVDLWDTWLPDVEAAPTVRAEGGLIVATSLDGRASLVSCAWPEPDRTPGLGFRYDVALEPGETWEAAISCGLGESASQLVADCRHFASTADVHVASARAEWDHELQSIFTPGNARFSGHLPVLETNDDAIRKLYWMGAVGLAYFKRDSPFSAVGRSYDTLMPRYWQTLQCIWDYFLSSPAHVLLDPAVMRDSLERWMQVDLHKHFGTEYLGGTAIGPWYAINDFAMTSMIERCAIWSEGTGWLEKIIGGRTVAEHCFGYATAWRGLRSASGLAAFGDEYNLLECVGSYVHEVAGFNAACVDSLRRAAGILDHLDRGADGDALREEADDLLRSLWTLYVEGSGFWFARMPEGRLMEVRHAMDLLTVLNTIPDDISDARREEMTAFFVRELQTPTWMRALSAADDDVLFSTRPDHQWTGAYGAWPSETAKGLCRIGRSAVAVEWMRGLARSANQGPFAQAHMADAVVPLESGGAAKSSYEQPYINDWLSSSSGSSVSAVIEGLFGVRCSFAGPSAEPSLADFDPDARLTGLHIRGASYTVDQTGIRLDDSGN